MPRRLSEETREKIEKLYSGGISITDIARQTGVSYSSVYGLTRARQRTNPETEKPYKSLTELHDYQARQRTNPETGKPFESQTDYLLKFSLKNNHYNIS